MTKSQTSRHNGKQKRIRKQKAIEKEFGEPFWDIVQGFADMGYGKYATAGAIEWDPSSFCRLVRLEGQHIRWPDYRDMNVWQDREYPDDWGERISAARRSSGKGLRYVEVGGEVITQRDYAMRRGVSDKQASRLRQQGKLREVTS